MGRRYSGAMLDEIGNTPIVQIESIGDSEIHAKFETFNPTGSMKDRIALRMIEQADLEPGDLVVEASSGNTGGAVAFVCSQKGYDCVITCVESTSRQKIGYMEAFGAEVVTCPDAVDSSDPAHYANRAAEIADERGGVFLDQYHNQANPEAHYRTTGKEVTEQLDVPEDGTFTHLLCPMSTGGTLSGIAKAVKESSSANPEAADVKTVGVDAEKSNVSAAFYDEQRGEYDTEVEGFGKSQELPTMWFEYIDEVRSVSDDACFRAARRLAREGFLIGPSSAAAIRAAEAICREEPGASVLTIVCDGGQQYFDVICGS